MVEGNQRELPSDSTVILPALFLRSAGKKTMILVAAVALSYVLQLLTVYILSNSDV